MDNIYLDNSATTRPSVKSIAACVSAMEVDYGNPSSLHSLGSEAAKLLNQARNEIFCALLGEQIRPLLPRSHSLIPKTAQRYGKLIFTSSGTEADNLAVMGSMYRYAFAPNKGKIITTDSEHPAVKEPIERLGSEGFTVVKLRTKSGMLDIEQLKNELTPDVRLVSIMMANNETGAVYDIKTAFALAHAVSDEIICHTDAIQAFQKTGFNALELGADMISISGHKVHAPKGIGALWINEKTVKKNRLSAYTLGGGQEDGLRSGSENIPGIAAFAAAISENGGARAGDAFESKARILREALINALPEGVRVNSPAGSFLPHIISLTLPIPRSQPMLNFLSSRGIYISSGSACSSHKNTVSESLIAFGLTATEAESTVRVSLDSGNTLEEITVFCNTLGEGIQSLYGKRKKAHP